MAALKGTLSATELSVKRREITRVRALSAVQTRRFGVFISVSTDLAGPAEPRSHGRAQRAAPRPRSPTPSVRPRQELQRTGRELGMEG